MARLKDVDLTQETPEDLDQGRRDILAEQERREALETIPQQIAELKAKYVAGGGNPKDLKTTD